MLFLLVLSRWKRDEFGNRIIGNNGLFILQFVAIKRKDSGEWAIPGVSILTVLLFINGVQFYIDKILSNEVI